MHRLVVLESLLYSRSLFGIVSLLVELLSFISPSHPPKTITQRPTLRVAFKSSAELSRIQSECTRCSTASNTGLTSTASDMLRSLPHKSSMMASCFHFERLALVLSYLALAGYVWSQAPAPFWARVLVSAARLASPSLSLGICCCGADSRDLVHENLF